MKILGISGSLRKNSYNTRLLSLAGQLMEGTATLAIFDISAIPFYNADIDGEIKPGPVQELLDAVAGSDGLLFASPEYNYSVSGVLKNAIDWASRPAYQSVLAHKPTGIISASMSHLGGARAQAHLRGILAGTLTAVYPAPDVLLPTAQKAFDETGMLMEKAAQDRLQSYLKGYLDWVQARTA